MLRICEKVVVKRGLVTSASRLCRARSYEPKPLPGSEEDKEPLKWASRLISIKKLKEQNGDKLHSASILNMICRVKKLKGVPHYQRAILEKYGLGTSTWKYSWVPVKNCPSVNEELLQIKHLIRVQAIEFPDGYPEPGDDMRHCQLLPNGKFIKHAKVVAEADAGQTSTDVNGNAFEAVCLQDDVKPSLDRVYLRKLHNIRWSRKQLFTDFFVPKYLYKMNQDKQEYRYNKYWRIDEAMKQSVASQKHPDGTFKTNTLSSDWNTYPWSKY